LAYGEYVVKKLSVSDGHRRFKEGQEDAQDDPRSGQPKMQRTDANVERMNLGAITLEIRCYLKMLTRLWESIWRKRLELWPDKWILYHDNTPAHDVLTVCKFLTKKSITKMDQPRYSTDSAPCNFWLFPKLKKESPEGTYIC
jgi:hypothetical protein